jgi:hypothetical protein
MQCMLLIAAGPLHVRQNTAHLLKRSLGFNSSFVSLAPDFMRFKWHSTRLRIDPSDT